MSGARAWGYWLRGSRCPQPDAGLRVIRHWVQKISGQVPGDWYVRQVLRQVLSHQWVESGPEVSGCRVSGSWSPATLLPALWLVEGKVQRSHWQV